MNKAERILSVVAFAVIIVIITGTTWAVMTGSRAKKLSREAIPVSVAAAGVYDGIGRVRARTNGDDGIAIVDIAFPYDASDRQFREELYQKRSALRQATEQFLSSKSAEELEPANESTVKAALRDTLNAMLSLGRIEELYFSEFHVVK